MEGNPSGGAGQKMTTGKSKESDERFVPVDGQLYRVFFEELTPNTPSGKELRQVVGYPVVFSDGTVLVRRRKGLSDVFLQSYHKMETFVEGTVQ
jgi:hypothetical protein